MPTGVGLRPGAKATEHPPDPIGGAPALDPTGERGEETCPRESACGPVAKAPDKSPAPYRQRASSRLYYNLANWRDAPGA